MSEPTKMDIVWMVESDKVIQSQIFLYQSVNHSDARLDWYKIPEGSYELYAGGPPTGPRFSIYLVDQIKSIEECNQKSLFPSKNILRLNYINSARVPLKICFQQKEDLKSWVEDLKKALFLGKKYRKKLEKEHKGSLCKSQKSCDESDENFYDTKNAKNTVAFDLDVDPTAASIRNGVVGDATIIISSNHITLFHRAKNYVISWQYRHVRRFGYSSSSFLLEGGHKSGPKGEGLFMFSNCLGHDIRECINAKTAVLDSNKSKNSEKCSSDDSDCSDYTDENMDKIYSAIKKIHGKPDVKQNKLLPDEEYANSLPDECVYQNKSLPKVPQKPFKLPVKPQNYSQPPTSSNPKMSVVVQALSKLDGSHQSCEDAPSDYSSLSFGERESRQTNFDLSLVTGNLYGEALCQQNGFQQPESYTDAEYSQVNYDKAKDNVYANNNSNNKDVKSKKNKK